MLLKEAMEDANLTSGKAQLQAYQLLRRCRQLWQVSLIKGRPEYWKRYSEAKKLMEKRAKKANGEFVSAIDVDEVRTSQMQWIRRTIDTLRELQSLEAGLLNDLSSRGLIISVADAEVLAAMPALDGPPPAA